MRYEETTDTYYETFEELVSSVFKRSQTWKPKKIMSLCHFIKTFTIIPPIPLYERGTEEDYPFLDSVTFPGIVCILNSTEAVFVNTGTIVVSRTTAMIPI